MNTGTQKRVLFKKKSGNLGWLKDITQVRGNERLRVPEAMIGFCQ